jgi:NitT/TauT family transport system ATP-binding protein
VKLQVRNLSKKFKSTSSNKAEYVIAIENIDLTISDGEFVSIVGPSGCGKSTLLNILAGLDKPTEGEIFLNGHEIDGTGPDRIMVFQENALFPWLKVIENVEFGLKIAGLQKDKRRQIALAHLETMQLTKFADSYVYQLSGGMKQRVALARALVLDPEILLMDEPFASLDSQTRDLLSVELQLIWSRTRKNIIFVTHNIMESVCLGDKVFVFTSRPGKIKREITINHRRPRLTEDDELKPFYREVLGELRSEISAARKQKAD